MNDIHLKRLSFGGLYPAGDKNFPVLAEERQRLDVDRDIPKLCAAAGIKPGDLVIDVGGFVGDTALAFYKEGARVLMFEPFLDSYVAALYNTRDAEPGMIACVNSPVGNGEPVRFIHECPGSNYGMRRMATIRIGDPTKPDAIAVRLDRSMHQMIRQRTVRLLKIDCEGSEIPTLIGARQLIAGDRPILYVEMYEDGLRQRGFTPQDLEDTIKMLGYSLEMWGEPPRWDWLCRPL